MNQKTEAANFANAIQNAVDAAATGDTVFIPAGTYKVKSYRDAQNPYGIRLKGYLTLRLDPGATRPQ